MRHLLTRLPLVIVIAAGLLMLIHGPIAQPINYHDFADQSVLARLPHAADVLSNIGFTLIGLWGFRRLRSQRNHPAINAGWYGYRLFLLGLVLTGAGSWFYHLDPDNIRLVWDRLPIALACAGLLAAVRAETGPVRNARSEAAVLALCAVISVAWWHFTELRGDGDLRPYLMLQFLPVILIPIWQSIGRTPTRDRLAFGAALLAYVVAKVAELQDQQVLELTGWISGHTLKHLLATAAAGVIVGRLIARASEACTPELTCPNAASRTAFRLERPC